MIVNIKVYKPADPPGPDDDPDEIDTPIAVEFPESFVDREYEGFSDGYLTMTEQEVRGLHAALDLLIDQGFPVTEGI